MRRNALYLFRCKAVRRRKETTAVNRLLSNNFTFAVFAFIGSAGAAHAQIYTFFSKNATINYAVSTQYAIVGYAGGDFTNGFNNPSSPTVSFVSGGGAGYLNAYNASVVNAGSGSNIGETEVRSATINFSGGDTIDLFADNNSVVNVSRGNINGYLLSDHGGSVSVSGGKINQGLTGDNNSGGSVSGGLRAFNGSVLNIGGGSGDFVQAVGGVVNLSGGRIRDSLTASYGGAINIYGSSLAATLTDPDYYGGSASFYSLSGALQDGTALLNEPLYIQNTTGASFHLFNAVPESGSLALFVGMTTIGAEIFRCRRRK